MGVIVNPALSGSPQDSDHTAATSAKIMVSGDTIFTVVGDIQIVSLVSECQTANGATASTLQFSSTTALGSTLALSNASTSLANVAAGYSVAIAAGSSLAEAPIQSASGIMLNTASRGVRLPAGALKIVIGVGSTTGTWRHFIRYEPLLEGSYIIAA